MGRNRLRVHARGLNLSCELVEAVLGLGWLVVCLLCRYGSVSLLTFFACSLFLVVELLKGSDHVHCYYHCSFTDDSAD